MRLERYIDNYIQDMHAAFQQLDREAIAAVIDTLLVAWRKGQRIFLIGNGGSAALASHMANDLNKLTLVPGQRRFQAQALTDNVPLLTAWANDADYESVFAEQLRGLCRPDDIVLAISCSGNSRNVLVAVELAKTLGAKTIAFTGAQGGKLADMVDLCVFAPVSAIYQQEDVHMMLNHILASALHRRISDIANRMRTPPRALVLAAGKGTRLHPLTQDLPKPMAPIDGRPLLEYTLHWLRSFGIEDIALNLHHCPQAITEYFGDGSPYHIRLHYSYENSLLGTAGAMTHLDGFWSEEPLVVVYGDVLTNLDLNALLLYHHENVIRNPATAVTMSLYRVSNPTEVGLVGLDEDGRITRFLEKPAPEEVFTNLANAGILVVEPSVLQYIPSETFYDFGHHLLPCLLEKGLSLYGWIIPETTYLLDIGSPEKYAQAQREWPLHFDHNHDPCYIS